MTAQNNKNQFVIGIDGGGTKTTVALADLQGKIISQVISGISNPRNIGIKAAAANIAAGVKEVLKGIKKPEILSVFIGLPAVEEEYKNKKSRIIAELKSNKSAKATLNSKITVASDQLVAFRSGTDSQNGIMIIAGTGCAAHGWRDGREAKANGWGWLADEGSAFWIGQKTFQSILKSFDDRLPDRTLEKIALEQLRLKKLDDLVDFAYANPAKHIPMLFRVCTVAADKGDNIAREILMTAAKEISLSVFDIAEKMDFKDRVPLVFVGGAFRSGIILETAKQEIRRRHPDLFEFIIPADPVVGAVKLALENIKKI
jgi:N-acetylglucosamine kinase-like BadF-type ATPase